jgi:hypothetical protein
MFSGNIVEGDWSKKEMFWKTVMAFPEPLPLKLSDAKIICYRNDGTGKCESQIMNCSIFLHETIAMVRT